MFISFVEFGIGIFIDDFGSGYFLLFYLKELFVIEIKLDCLLVIDICSNENVWVIIEIVINMVYGLGYGVIVEGVEDEVMVWLFKSLGCNKL